MSYAAEQFGIDAPEAWYSISAGDFVGIKGGASFLKGYHDSVAAAVTANLPAHSWDVSRFSKTSSPRVDQGRVKQAALELKIPSMAGWYFLEPSDISQADASAQIQMPQFLKECFPEHHWDDKLLRWRETENSFAVIEFIGSVVFPAQGPPTHDQWYSLKQQRLEEAFGALSARNLAQELPAVLARVFSSDLAYLPWRLELGTAQCWTEKETRVRFWHWASKQLDIGDVTSLDKWYSVSRFQIRNLRGLGLLREYYGGSLHSALVEAFPSHTWFPWPFESRGSLGFWMKNPNVERFLEHLSSRLEVRTMDDWYKLSQQDFLVLRARKLLALHQGSPLAFLQARFPQHRFVPWKFLRQPRGQAISKSSSPEALEDFVKAVAEELGVAKLPDWYRVSLAQLKAINAEYAISKFGGLFPLLQTVYPEHAWSPSKLSVSSKKSNQRTLLRAVRRLFPAYNVVEDSRVGRHSNFELDVFVPELHLGFEYQGEYHFMDVLFSGEAASSGDRDAGKASALARAGISLVVVPYSWDGMDASLSGFIRAVRPELAQSETKTEKSSK